MADQWRDSNNDEQLWSWDRFCHARTVMDHEHRMVHDGFGFHTTHRVDVANGGTLDYLLNVPAGCFPHNTGVIATFEQGDWDVITYKDTITSADGTAVTSHNRNLNSSNAACMLLTHTPTITDIGTQFHDRYVYPTGTGQGNQEGLVSPNTGEEWVLKPATKYLIRFTNNSGGTAKVVLEHLWYEIGYEV